MEIDKLEPCISEGRLATLEQKIESVSDKVDAMTTTMSNFVKRIEEKEKEQDHKIELLEKWKERIVSGISVVSVIAIILWALYGAGILHFGAK